jgi:hypothetical protein
MLRLPVLVVVGLVRPAALAATHVAALFATRARLSAALPPLLTLTPALLATLLLAATLTCLLTLTPALLAALASRGAGTLAITILVSAPIVRHWNFLLVFIGPAELRGRSLE